MILKKVSERKGQVGVYPYVAPYRKGQTGGYLRGTSVRHVNIEKMTYGYNYGDSVL